jgi:hypothetical protein
MQCNICQSTTQHFSQAVVLGRYNVAYYRCSQCGFIQTEPPAWLACAYTEATSAMDVSVMRRNLAMAELTNRYISRLFNPDARFYDFGGGNGIFVRLMRDFGFDFRWCDLYAKNLFARGFEGEEDSRYELVTAFEVFEHLEKPMEIFAKLFRLSPNLLFSTELIPPDRNKPGEWYYYSLETGQHISFYTLQTLRHIAQYFGRKIYSCGSVHLLTEKNMPHYRFKLSVSPKTWHMLRLRYRRPSLHYNDYLTLSASLQRHQQVQ